MFNINIPLKKDAIIEMGDCGFVDYAKLAEKTELKIACGNVEFSVVNDHKEVRTDDLYHPWSKIPSSYTDIACKVFDAEPRANVYWGYLQIKASPAKVMQGHNVYGSEDFRLCCEYILDSLQTAQPELWDLLDIGLAELTRIDCTYSVKCANADIMRQAIKQMSNVSNRYVRPARNSDYETTLYFNRATKANPGAGRSFELCIYTKHDEIEYQLNDLKKRAKKGNTERFQRVIDELSSPELQAFAANRLRFEGRAKKRFIQKHAGNCNLWHVIRHAENFEAKNGYRFCEWMFKTLFHDLLESLQGEELELYNEHKIKCLLRDAYSTLTPKGNISYAKADRLFRFYMTLCDRGYDEIKAHTSKATLHRNMKDLMAVGFSKADLQNLKDGERMPLAQVLTFDFDHQRPEGYQEPQSPIQDRSDLSYLAITYGVSPRLAHVVGLAEDPIELLRRKLNLQQDIDIDALIDGHPVPVSPRRAISLVIWPDGEMVLTTHDHTPDLFTDSLTPVSTGKRLSPET
ncbi:Phage replication protein CRI [Vibrio quintilis]|uniref:Phage replication protein CRI n=2 Tax=Vibrio quintilis TaxID=1117707 RepID=A0A1M7YPT0_9VIBR|nr:Phage replication protein CRI [Vibrio quintilis]